MTKRTCQTECGGPFSGLPAGRKGRDVCLIFWLLNYVLNQYSKKKKNPCVTHIFCQVAKYETTSNIVENPFVLLGILENEHF